MFREAQVLVMNGASDGEPKQALHIITPLAPNSPFWAECATFVQAPEVSWRMLGHQGTDMPLRNVAAILELTTLVRVNRKRII